MSSLYCANVVAVDGPIVRVQLTIVHPDVSEFGTDRFFAWKLLAEWVSPPDDDDDLTMAARHIKRVEVSPLENGTIAETLPTFFRVKRKGKKDPSVTYTIEVTDPAILESIEVGDRDDLSIFVEPDKVVPESAVPAQAGGGPRRFESTADGSSKFWEALVQGSDLCVRWGRIGTAGQSQLKSFPSPEKARSEHDKLVAEKLKKGYSEVAGGDAPASAKTAVPAAVAASAAVPASANAAAVDAAKSPAKKGKRPAAEPSTPKTFDDLRNVTLELLRGEANGSGSWVEDVIGFIFVWAHEATDEQLMAWLDRLPTPEKGWLSQGAGLVAVQRALAGKADSAKRFLAVAESTLPRASEVRICDGTVEPRMIALEGLLPAWWRLGKDDDANKAFAGVNAELFQSLGEERQRQAQCGMAALGGQKELAEKLIGGYQSSILLAIAAFAADGFEELLAKCLKTWTPDDSSCQWDLSRVLVRELVRRGEPERYLELAVEHPVLLSRWEPIGVALVALEKKDPKKAVAVAERLLDGDEDDVRTESRLQAVAVLAAQAPARAEAWAKKNAALLEKKKGGHERYVWLAALGRTDEARGGIKELVAAARNDDEAVRNLAMLGAVTNDRALAVEALKAHVDRSASYDDVDAVLVQLLDLGERSFVDERLDDRLAEIEKRAPKDRGSECRKLAKSAGMTGRPDLGLAACALPTKSVRRYAAGEWVRGCASVGDWTSALTALELDPDDSPNGRISTAVQSGLRCALDAPVDGPRAVPLRALRGASPSADAARR